MSWKRHFTITAPIAQQAFDTHSSSGTASNFSSYLPEVYAGDPGRIQRYYQFDNMDRDSDINAALDTIADFCTQSEEQNKEPFDIHFNDDANETEINILKRYLVKWIKLNDFRQRMFYIFRNTIKNGDAFFLRDPETKEWLWMDHFNVEMVKIDEENGKKPQMYFVRGFDYNAQLKFATRKADLSKYKTPFGVNNSTIQRPQGSNNSFQMNGGRGDIRQLRQAMQGNEMFEIDAEHVIHLSLSVGMDVNYPFGQSILEAAFKTFKQKELLEDAMLIYRVQRAPERRVFYIDTGALPPPKARAELERVKNEIHQRRIPNHTGGGSSMIDASYNPLSIMEDFFFSQGAEGRGSKVETLPGGECLALDTKIPLLDGRTLPLSEIIEEHNAGKQLWAYSCNPSTGAIVPGMINWAGVTRRDAKVMKITLDNGEEITVTPDHKFPTLARGTQQARDLEIGDSLIPFNTRTKEIKQGRTKDYTQVYDNETKQWVFAHRMVAEYFRDNLVTSTIFDEKYRDNTKTTVHHIDHDRFNNDPSNLTYMNWNDHYEYHSSQVTSIQELARQGHKQWWENMNEIERIAFGNAIRERNKASFAAKTEEEKEEFRAQARLNLINGNAVEMHQEKLRNDPEWRQAMLEKRSETMKQLFINEPERAIQIGKRSRDMWNNGGFDHIVEHQTFKFDDVAFEMLCSLINRKSNKETLAEAFNNNATAIAYVRELNRNTRSANVDYSSFNMRARHVKRAFDSRGIKFNDARKGVVKSMRTFVSSPKMLKIVSDTLRLGHNNLKKMLDALNNNSDFIAEYKSNNTKQHHLVKNFSYGMLLALVQDFGYTDWKHFKRDNAEINHQIVSIEYLDETMDTGTITIDGMEVYHGYHTFALASGVFTYNSVGEIADLTYFSKKMARALRIPSSYLALGEDEGQVSFNDGKLGAAMIQEYRFNKYCMRLQALLAPVFDAEFKAFLKANDVSIDSMLFELHFNEPQNFTKYRQIEVDQAQVGVYQMVEGNRRLSERFKLKRFMNLNEDELLENERLWAEENAAKLKRAVGSSPAEDDMGSAGLSDIGIRPPSGDSFDDMPAMDDFGDEMAPMDNEPPAGDANAPAGGAAPQGGPAGAGGPPAGGGPLSK